MQCSIKTEKHDSDTDLDYLFDGKILNHFQ